MSKYRRNTPYHPRRKPVHDFLVKSHPMYQIWANMISRCENKDESNYHDYGGRGIKVCTAWRHSFEKFAMDMGMPPTPTHTLDRVNNDLGYSPENCRWATRTEQCHNRRKFKNNTTGYEGVVAVGDRFTSRYDHAGVRYQFGRFATAKEAADMRAFFISIFDVDRESALMLTERRARCDSTTGVRGITRHVDGGYMVRKTIEGVRKYLGYRKTYEEAHALWTEHN